jgi:hypothetical protein
VQPSTCFRHHPTDHMTCCAVLSQVLSNSKGPNCIQLPMEDDVQLTHEQLDRLAGQAVGPAVAAAAASQDGKSGLTFPITSSGGLGVLATTCQPGSSCWLSAHRCHTTGWTCLHMHLKVAADSRTIPPSPYVDEPTALLMAIVVTCCPCRGGLSHGGCRRHPRGLQAGEKAA